MTLVIVGCLLIAVPTAWLLAGRTSRTRLLPGDGGTSSRFLYVMAYVDMSSDMSGIGAPHW